MNVRRNAGWLVAALLFGALLLPFLVYYTGTMTLGPYSHGGPLGFYGDFLASLARLQLVSLVLAARTCRPASSSGAWPRVMLGAGRPDDSLRASRWDHGNREILVAEAHGPGRGAAGRGETAGGGAKGAEDCQAWN